MFQILHLLFVAFVDPKNPSNSEALCNISYQATCLFFYGEELLAPLPNPRL